MALQAQRYPVMAPGQFPGRVRNTVRGHSLLVIPGIAVKPDATVFKGVQARSETDVKQLMPANLYSKVRPRVARPRVA
jgi:hypothetical protein